MLHVGRIQVICKNKWNKAYYSSPYHPASNGLAERAVQTVKNGLKKITEGNLEIRLSKFLARYRILPHGTTGVSPAELLLKRKVRTKLDLLLPSTSATENKSLENQKLHHDRKAREREFSVGNTVYVQNFGKGPELLAGIITERRGPVSYIMLPDGRCLRRHVDHIRNRQCEPVDNVPLLPVEKPPVDVFTPSVSPKVPMWHQQKYLLRNVLSVFLIDTLPGRSNHHSDWICSYCVRI